MMNNQVTDFENCSRGKVNQFDISFMRVCTNKSQREIVLEDEKEMKDVMVEVAHQDGDRIITLVFLNCEDENYLHLKKSINEVKQDLPFDYEARDNSYIFRLEFDSVKEISSGGDICATKNKCYVDEDNNTIVFIGR